MWNVCPKCNHLNSDDSKRCEQCGFKLSGPRLTDAPKPSYEPVPVITYEYKEPKLRQKRDYLNDWFGPQVPYAQKRANATITAVLTIVLLLTIAYTVQGFFCNTIMWLVFGGLVAFVIHRNWKRDWSEEKTVAVAVFVILPLFILAIFPWSQWSGDGNQSHVPVFVSHLSYYTVTVEYDGSRQIVVDGYITNEGQEGGRATVVITAYGGPPDNYSMPAYEQGYVDVGWIEPGNSAYVHWTCNLAYFNAMGQVSWEIIDTGSY